MLAILAILVIASFRITDRLIEARNEFDPISVLDQAADILANEGLDSLKAYLARDDVFPPGHTLYVYAPDGEDILGRGSLAEAQAFSRRGPAEFERRRRFPRGLRRLGRIMDAEGVTYLARFGPLEPSALGMFRSNEVRWLVLGSGAAITLLMCFLLSKYLSAPLTRIAATADALAGGQLDARVGAASHRQDEIGKLSRQFDAMATVLQNEAGEREELFRNISHELRSPVARIQVAAELAERKPESAHTYLQRIRDEARQMDVLTGQVLELARIRHAGDPERSDLDLVEVVDQVAQDAAFEGSARRVGVEWQPPQAPVMLHASWDHVRSAVENVVRNALRYAPGDSSIEIGLEHRDGATLVRIRDSGPGVPEDRLPTIFRPFQRSENETEGSGIGLAITAGVMDLLGGSARARNRPGGGLEVELRFPSGRAHGEPDKKLSG